MKKLQETCEAALLKAYKIASRGDFYEKIAEAGAENERLSEEK